VPKFLGTVLPVLHLPAGEEKSMIQEVIIVEGKQDIARVKQAVEAEIIATGGFTLAPYTVKQI
jgi:5S rRNA maturation endonuclease (ribonuclease M5)